MKEKKYFCYEIFKNLSIWSTQDKITYNPCSIYKGYYKRTSEVNIAQVWNSPEHQALKEMVKNDIPIPGCQRCYQEEESGRKSRRQSVRETYENFHADTTINLDSPTGLDYSVGNLCNLKCMICGPNNSTAWISDYQLIYPENSFEQYKYKKNLQKLIEDDSMLKNIKTLHFHGGGEPLLSDIHYKLLKKIDQAKGLGDVRVFYNTNATVLPDKKTLDIWEKCLLIELYFSLDDIEHRFEYQRTGASWKQVVKNIEIFKNIMPHNHLFKINCVWSFLNLYYLDKLYDWYETSLKTNRYGDPTELIFQKAIGEFEVLYLKTSTKNILLEKFKKYPALQNLITPISISDDFDNQEFWNYVKKIDSVRKTNFQNVCPEWFNLI